MFSKNRKTISLEERYSRYHGHHHDRDYDSDDDDDKRYKKDRIPKAKDDASDDLGEYDIMKHHEEYTNSNIENMIAKIIPAVVKTVSKQNGLANIVHPTITKRNFVTPIPTVRPSIPTVRPSRTSHHTTHTLSKSHRTQPHTTKRPTRSIPKPHHTTPGNLNMILKGLKALGISPNSLNKKPGPTAFPPTPTHPHVVSLHDSSKIRILCFGDSLTAGYNSHGKNFFPYCSRLKKILNYRSITPVYTETKGVVGEMTHKQMTNRLPLVLGNATFQYDWVIILGGTNDILHVKNFADDQEFLNQLENVWEPRITKDIEKLHDTAYKFGAHTMLLTVPENSIETWPNYKPLLKMRKRINESLRKFAAASKGKTVLCDVAKKLPRHTLGPIQEARFWDDHLHMTPEGYTKMAGLVSDCLRPYLPHSNGW